MPEIFLFEFVVCYMIYCYHVCGEINNNSHMSVANPEIMKMNTAGAFLLKICGNGTVCCYTYDKFTE